MNILSHVMRNVRGPRARPGAAPERRAAPRFTKRLEVTVLDVALSSTNVTEDGLQLECPAARLHALRSRWREDATPVRVLLPSGEPIEAVCAVTYVSECEDDFLIGLRFQQMDPRAGAAWQAYLANRY